jgi:hypothetical protein
MMFRVGKRESKLFAQNDTSLDFIKTLPRFAILLGKRVSSGSMPFGWYSLIDTSTAAVKILPMMVKAAAHFTFSKKFGHNN